MSSSDAHASMISRPWYPHMLLMKFPTPYDNGYIRGDQLSAQSCYNTSVKQQHLHVPKETFSIHDQVIKTSPNEANLDLHGGNSQPEDPRDDSFTQQAQPAEELEKVYLKRLSGLHGEDWYHLVTTHSVGIDLFFAREH
ncbi:hypothetical protein C1H46_021627 [Malus baccata]|uniref:Uncharacterized protein n=1 Tax=Malus baccata TaxID=106549 RepID=A0A540M2I5_MALBA|nr:hypothetical protein C1H46_021627 [Malus baccata]